MAFMQHQITDKQAWVEIDGNCGITFVPAELFTKEGLKAIRPASEADFVSARDEDTAYEIVKDYYEGHVIYSINVIDGYGARLSAPGYMDCTDWAVFDTPEEAKAYLEEYYGDDEETENEEAG